jgi:murein endopeptidase
VEEVALGSVLVALCVVEPDRGILGSEAAVVVSAEPTGAESAAFAGAANTQAATAASAILPQTLNRTGRVSHLQVRKEIAFGYQPDAGPAIVRIRPVRARSALLLVAAALAAASCSYRTALRPTPATREHIHARRQSIALGLPWNGSLLRGVRLPGQGLHYFTWDPVRRRSPDRPWRRYGTDRLVRVLLQVIDAYAAAHPDAARVGVGDLSRPHGGDFGIRYGWPGHVSHQNGLDVDVYYPRRDRSERAPTRPDQIDRALAQDLVDRFVRAGAVRVFVGPHTGLTGPPETVQMLAHHDNHLHVRLPNSRNRAGPENAVVR